jgi:Transcriptional regulators
MSVTSKEVAKRAHVSASTVSRAFSRPDKVEAGTRARILEVAKELGYQPNKAASLLSLGKTGCIGALIPDLNNPFFAGVLKGISEETSRMNMQLFVNDFSDDRGFEAQQANTLSQLTDGLILCSSRLTDDEIRQLNTVIPVVLLNRRLKGIPYVHFDNAGGIRQAVLHLSALGHTRIGYCAGPGLSRSASERMRAFLQTTDEVLSGTAMVLGEFESTFAGGNEAADEALNAGVTAVIAYNDVMAIGMMHRLLSYEIDLPEKLSIVGIDNIPVSEMVTPSLTTVQLPQAEAGAKVTQLLHSSIEGKPLEGVEMASSLVVRQSTTRAL